MSGLAGDLRVSRAKIVVYLLNAEHIQGRHKARVFGALGFDPRDPEGFAVALERHGRDNRIVTIQQTPFGTKAVVECDLACLDGSTRCITTVWVAEVAEVADRYRLVTAYPTEPR